MLTEIITILLVEDNSGDPCLVREILQDIEAFQFQLIHVSNLADALTYLAAKTSISVILLDLSLPDAQGLDPVTQVLLASPDIPVVVLSSIGDEAIALQALQKGAQDYLVKGDTDAALLVRSIRYAIERQQMQQRLQQAQQELRQRTQREALVNRITVALNSELDPRRILDEIVRHTARPMNCDCCMVVRALPEVNSICVEAEYWPNSGEGVKLQGQIAVTTGWQQVCEVLQQNQLVVITSEQEGTAAFVRRCWGDQSFSESIELMACSVSDRKAYTLPYALEESYPSGSLEYANSFSYTVQDGISSTTVDSTGSAIRLNAHPLFLSPIFQSVSPEQRPVTMLLAPIFVREQYYGHLLVGYLQPREPFSEGEIHLLQQLAWQTALVLYNAQQLEQLEQLVQARPQELAQEKTLLEAIVNSIQEGICVMQPDGQVVLTNPAEWQIFGLEPEDATGPLCKWLDRLQIQEPDSSVPSAEELPITRTLRGEGVTDYELVVRCPNGDEKWISVNGATVRDQAGKIQLAINTTRDITERKQTEEALLRHDRLLGGVAAAMTQLLITSDYQVAMTRSLTVLGVAADVDRVYIFENHCPEKNSIALTSQRFEWARDKVAVPNNPQLQNLSYEIFLPRWYESLATGKPIKGLVRDFPQVEREILEPQSLRSILVVPVMTEGKFWGFIGFADCTCDRQWTEHEESILTVIAGSLGGAIVRASKEQALRESEAKYRTLYESTSAAVMLLDENGILDGNSAALQMFGCTQREQLCGREEEKKTGKYNDTKTEGEPRETQKTRDSDAESFIEMSPYSPHPLGFSPPVQPNGQDSLSLANEYIATALREGNCRFDWIYRKRNGKDFPAEVTLTLIELGNRKVLQAVIYDIADRKETEAELLQAKEAAEAGSLAKSEFLATMSHELRTPLNAVLGLSQLMRQEIFGTLNEKQKEYITCIQSSGEHLLALINDILDLSKVEAGKEQLSFMPLDIQELCDSCLSLVREQAYEQGLKLSLHIDPQARICIADERRCKQMLLNLLSNAVKFTPVGEVSLVVRKMPEKISFTVKDTGIGIASEKLPLLFEPFRQLDSGLNRQFPGTGLGLALTRSLAWLHGGDVTVESTLGQGSEFTLHLPDLPSEELLFSASSEELGETEGLSCPLWTKSRILLVENDERSAMLLKDYLQVIGHRVEHLSNGTDFLQQVRSFKPNLILMDVQLRGDCTGFDLLEALRRDPDTKHLTVVMATAMAMAGDRERCLEAGADDYLSKPIGIAQLEAILMRYL